MLKYCPMSKSQRAENPLKDNSALRILIFRDSAKEDCKGENLILVLIHQTLKKKKKNWLFVFLYILQHLESVNIVLNYKTEN